MSKTNPPDNENQGMEVIGLVIGGVFVAAVIAALTVNFIWLITGLVAGVGIGWLVAWRRKRVSVVALIGAVVAAFVLAAALATGPGPDWQKDFHFKLVDKTAREMKKERRDARAEAKSNGQPYVDPEERHGKLDVLNLHYGPAFSENWTKLLALALAPFLLGFSVGYVVPDRRLRAEEQEAQDQWDRARAAEAEAERKKEAARAELREDTKQGYLDALEEDRRRRESEEF